MGQFKIGAILKFLAPDFLIGLFLALSNGDGTNVNFPQQLGAVALGIALLTSMVETRRMFFTGGDLEDFYFVQPTAISRFASFSTVFILDFIIVLSVSLPSLALLPVSREYSVAIAQSWLSATFVSTALYFLVVSLIAIMPVGTVHSMLTGSQVLMALILLAVFQLSSSLPLQSFAPGRMFPISCVSLFVSAALFIFFPFQEKLVLKLKDCASHSRLNLAWVAEHAREILFIRSEEEEAGFLFFVSNIFRNQSFRLSTIGISATPVMVAIYWTLLGFHFVNFDPYSNLLSAELVAPIASLIMSAVVVHYVLSQNLLSSKDCDAAWLFKAIPHFSTGKFVLGFRKSFLTVIHVPTTLAVFLVVLHRDSLLESVVTALTFFLLVHVAVSCFSVMQGNFPFTLPFKQIVSNGVADLIFLLVYSIVATWALFMSYGEVRSFFELNLFAIILTGVLEFLSTKITDRRVRLDV